MIRKLWTLKGRLQYTLAIGLLKKKKEWKKEEPKGDGYIVSPYLRQTVENLLACSNESLREQDKSFIVNGLKLNETRGKVHERKGINFVIEPSLKWT